MHLTVEIERHSGFCGGVINAIGKAEKFLAGGRRLYSLGAIVHNEAELERLHDKGLETISLDDVSKLPSPKDETVLIRAHGEPPETYSRLHDIGINVIDCTCPVVLRLQRSIKETYSKIHNLGGQIVIFGKIGHAEVLGLVGQVGGDAIVIEDVNMLSKALESGALDLGRPIAIFSQTTKSPDEYKAICDYLQARASSLDIHETICSQVAFRHKELSDFATSHDVIIFVSGSSSSNGKVLFSLCKSRNPRSCHISSPKELDASWFHDGDRVGICGATSTPRWLLEATADAIEGL
jgi:4-hydroxy-3-methylbut-2-enyl diphosphate reductase